MERRRKPHALAALGWALIERHNLREHLGFKSETVMTFLLKVEPHYRSVAVIRRYMPL